MSIQNIVTGNVGNIPTFKNVPLKDGSTVPVCNFSLASSDYRRVGNNDYEQIGETAWLECNLWGDKAESLAKVLQKGMPIVVIGTEQTRKNEKDGQTYINRVLNVERIALNLLSPRIEEIKLRAKEGSAPADPETSTASDIPF
ncbi:MAG: single-stranded DNA-binding protein [Neisseriaceae bacterium]|nr:single-stranded DNA-binding protein [Neisseriaceae bacterium]